MLAVLATTEPTVESCAAPGDALGRAQQPVSLTPIL